MEMTALPALTRDLRKATTTLTVPEARYLVDTYYGIQDFRIQTGNQIFALNKSEEPHATVDHFHQSFKMIEGDIAKALDAYSAAQPMGAWVRQHIGIGPVIAAGLLAQIDITRSPTPSSLWKFAGLAPGQGYVKGEKRSWNASLKLLCWKVGDSMVKQSGRPNCYYGHLYLERKAIEVSRNEAVRPSGAAGHDDTVVLGEGAAAIGGYKYVGGNAMAAANQLLTKNIKDKDLRALLMQGKLPPGQLDMRARRYSTKRLLAHYWEQAMWYEYGVAPRNSYVQDYLGHTHIVDNPFVPFDKRKAA